tara:strand:+ start:4421 stop:4573 length:153 start_codon:yes stop_codon:yes gene_type:complete
MKNENDHDTKKTDEKQKIIYNKKESIYNDLKIDELLEKQFKNYNLKFFDK